jgi:hypothetical protein
MFNMKKLVLIFSLVCISSHAEWTLLYTDEDKSQFFWDPETITVVDSFKRIWILNELENANSQGTKSFRSVEEYDCANTSSRVMQIAAFRGGMATGQLLAKQQGSGQWKKIKEGTVEEMILQKVCGITQ